MNPQGYREEIENEGSRYRGRRVHRLDLAHGLLDRGDEVVASTI